MAAPFVKRYLVALDRHKWAGLASFAVVMGLSGVAALQPAPPASYESRGILSYSAPPVLLTQTGAALQQQGQALTEGMLLSNYVVDTTVQRLGGQQIQITPSQLRLNTTVEVNPDDGDRNRAPAQNAAPMAVVTYQDVDESRAQLINTLLLETMVEQSRQFNTQQIRTIINNLNELLPDVSAELQAAERRLEEYIRTQAPAIQAAEDGNLVQGITGSQQQQRQLRFAIDGIDAQIRSLQSRLGLSPDQAYTSSALSADPIIADLRARIYQNESQMAILAESLRANHPTMVDLRNQNRALDRLLQQRVAEVIGGNQLAAPLRSGQIRQDSSLDPARQQLANTLVNLQTQRDTLQQQLVSLDTTEQELRQAYTALPNKQIEQARLEQQVALKRAFYDQIQTRLADVTIAENETPGNLVITQPPLTQLAEETGRNGLVILIVGGIVGLLVSGGLVLLLDSLDATFHTLPDLQIALRQQEVPILGLLPNMAAPQEADSLPVIVEVDSPYIDAYERFRSNLRRASGNKALKMILITSTVASEGKTVSAYNLAIASARAGKRTLLVEGDLRSPSSAKALRVAPDPDSMVEPLRYYGHLSDCIRLVPEIENLYILPSPGAQRQAAAILESNEMRRMLEDVRGRFDLVIIDTPALSRYNDALLLEPFTDGIVLITRPGFTEEGLLAEAVEQFTESEDIQFLGAVINGADIPVQTSAFSSGDDQFIVEDLEGQSELEKVGTSSRDV